MFGYQVRREKKGSKGKGKGKEGKGRGGVRRESAPFLFRREGKEKRKKNECFTSIS